ncbi:MAG: aspartate 1-decarboxylase [Rickettsiales bacterium]|nr:aspartate 1-decarboxylase [Rickettsiales bacterium]RPG14396.1 MAG: aspartate 1-decarboxylase [Pelagibacteraceae bacterium TMED195]
MLKSKLHRAKITEIHLDYEGSCAIDEELLEAASINEYEMIHIYNLNNGNRFVTYAIKAEKGSGIISLNGAAAYQGNKDDLIIICTYAEIDQNKAKEHEPKLIYFKEQSNIINKIKSQIPTQKNNVVSL